MSREFTQFGDASRLYSKYREVVDRMHKAYQDDVDAFLEALTTRLTSMMEPEELRQKTWTGIQAGAPWSYYNWWLDGWPFGDEKKPADGPAACLYLDLISDSPQIAVPGTLHVSAYLDTKRDDLREAIGSVKSQLPTTWQVVKPRDQGNGDLFTVIVSYGEDKDPVAFAAKPIAELLRLMNDAIMKVGKSQQKEASR